MGRICLVDSYSFCPRGRKFLNPSRKHHKEYCDSASHVNTVNTDTDLHPDMLDVCFGVGENGKDSAKDHKRGIAGNHNFSRRRL